MEYSEASEVVGPARYNLNTTKRSLEDRVRDYTGHSLRQDERLDHPAGSSSGRSSDSRSPFLEGQGTRHKRRGGGGGGREMMMSDQYETPHIPQTLRGDTHTIWETKLDQDYLSYVPITGTVRPDLVMANTLNTNTSHTSGRTEEATNYLPQPEETVVMPGFPVQTLTTSHHQPPPPYSPDREKSPFSRPCLFHCSWKVVAVGLTVLTVLLSSVIVYFGAVKFPTSEPPPLPNSVIDSSGLHDLTNNCIPQQEQPSQDYHWRDSASSDLPETLVADQWVKTRLGPYQLWLAKLSVTRQALHQFNVTIIEGGQSLAVFGRHLDYPSVTKHDWVEYILSEDRRFVSEAKSVSSVLSEGSWYIGIYNDAETEVELGLVTSLQVSGAECADCGSHGKCVAGLCQCEPQWTGERCEASLCPILCSGHGHYGGGRCHCQQGWKGEECEVRHDECEVADCHGHGACVAGLCQCQPGWTGTSCQERDCLDRSCSQHGTCSLGVCYCHLGWMGETCEQRNTMIQPCIPDCNNRGTFDIRTGQCRCREDWTGPQCEVSVCSLDCGQHGECQGGECVCQHGWGGGLCEVQQCEARCDEHGQCVNGSCVCQQGWNGRHCSLEGCGQGCGGHGTCRHQGQGWACSCHDGWGGDTCQRRQETDCQDEIDNDKDGLVDCGDSNCCSHPACKENIMCVYFADPVDVLLRKPPPPPSAGFFAKVRFLIEGDKSVQSYSKPESYDERRASVIRGRVLTSAGEGIIGVRVSVDRSRGASNYGFTLTRPGGWFDLLVNGGGAVTLQFQRSPFKPLTRTSYIPWNQIYVMDSVVMASNGGAGISWEEEDSSLQLQYSAPCLPHTSTIRPVLVATEGQDRAVPSHPANRQISQAVMVDSGTLLQSVNIPGTRVQLVYDSSAASGSLSTIKMLLTPEKVPSSLYRVHVKIVVAGVVVTQLLEAEESLIYTYSWDKRNVYNQKVYGRTEARISAGYQYRECEAIVWETQTMSLPGYPVDITNIGGWNIDIHHHFDPFQGILQKGDGSRLDFSKLSKIIEPLMGNARQRDFQCDNSKCQGEATSLSLLNVVSMTTGPDGSVFVGDYNLIRKIDPEGNVFTILEFSSAQGSFLYEISISPADDSIYMTNSERHQVWRLLKLEDVTSPADNYEVVAGTGQRCVPGPHDDCGDGGPATQARLAFPKGLAVSVDRSVYISDGKSVRIVHQNGKISTLIGGHSPTKHLVPIGCDTTYLADDVELHWPTNIALSPLDSSLHIVDDSQVLRLTPDLKLEVIAGSSMRCTTSTKHKTNQNLTEALAMRLGPIVDIGFAQSGDLYIGEKSVTNDYVLLTVRKDGGVEKIVGRRGDSREDGKLCLCQVGNCSACSTSQAPLMANQVIFKALSAFTISPEGNLHVADNGALQIFTIRPVAPSLNTAGNYQIVDAAVKEIYTFNKFGQHLLTQNIQTGATKQEFEYSKSLGFGKLLKVSDTIGNKLLLQRDYTHTVQFLENTFGQKYSTKMNSLGKLESVQISSRKEVKFAYNQNDFLLKSVSVTSGELYSYSYSPSGRLESAVSPSGEWLTLTEDERCLVRAGHSTMCLTAHLNGQLALNVSASPSTTELHQDSACGPKLTSEDLRLDWSDSSCSSRQINSVDISSLGLGLTEGLMRLPSVQTINTGNTLARMSLKSNWENYNFNGNAIFLNETQRVAGIDYDRTTNQMRISGSLPSSVILEVSLENGMLPVAWNYLGKVSCNSSYDSYGRLTTNLCGNSREEYIFNAKDENLYSKSHCNGRETKFMYENHELPRETRLASGRVVTYIYDSHGGLEQVLMPRGTRYGFWRQNGFGVTKIGYQLPGYSEPYVTSWDVRGRLVEVRPPGGDGLLLSSYTGLGRLARRLAGDRRTDFTYTDGLLTGVEHQRDGVNIRTSFSYNQIDIIYHSECDLTHYNQGVLSDQRINFDAKSAFADAKFSYDTDGNLNIKRIKGRIGGQSLAKVGMYFGRENTKYLQDIGYFSIESQGLNGSVVSDGNVRFSRADNFFSLSIGNSESFRAEYRYNKCNKLEEVEMLLKRSSGYFKQSKRFSYDDDGQILEVRENNHIWKYEYDANGNMNKLIFGKNVHKFEYNEADQLVGYNKARLVYDSLGRIVTHYKKTQFSYGTGNLLKEVTLSSASGKKIRYFYDHMDRLVGRRDSEGNLSQLHYSLPDRPYLVTQVYHPRESRVTHCVYDHQDKLVFVKINQDNYYVVTDTVGSPILFFSPHGDLIKEISRSPYGHVTYDSNPGIKVPIGLFGGIQDDETGLIHLQDEERKSVYDPFLGSFLTPDWSNLHKYIHQPERFLLYRINGNDPLNSPRRAKQSDLNQQLENTMKILGQSFPVFKTYELGPRGVEEEAPYSVQSSLPIVSSSVVNFLNKANWLQSIFQPWSSSLLVRGVVEPEIMFSNQEAILGNFIVLSKHGDAVSVTSGPEASNIYSDVFSAVLNNSRHVEFESSSRGLDNYYFTKRDSWRAADDVAQLRRLSSSKINLTVHESQYEASKVMDVRVHLANSVLNIRYGTEPGRERTRLVRHAARVLSRRVWTREQDIVSGALPGTWAHQWRDSQIKQILSGAAVEGWDIEYRHSPSLHPGLASDLENVILARTNKRRTRH